MSGRLGTLLGSTGRARLGAVALHLVAGVSLFSIHIAPVGPDPIKTVSIELVDARSVAPVEPELLETPEVDPTPDPAPIEDRAAVEPLPPEPEPEISAPAPQTSLAPVTPAPPPETPEAEEDDEENLINPDYIIRRDPFVELAPSASARVSAAMMCARANKETRPAFCPEMDDEDVRFAMLVRAQGDLDGFSRRADTMFAQSTLNEISGAVGYERFRDRQQSLDEFASTGASPVRKLGSHIPRHAEGLQNCTPVRTGIARVGGGTDGLSTELSNGSEVFCD